jgi:hypothetical protein
MKRAILAMLVTIFPLSAAAQDAASPAPAAPAEVNATASTAAAADSQATARRATKRRGSMVGYIEDPSVGSQVRIRFDAGSDIDSPDRAEFFYAKCGCYRGLAGNAAFDPDAPGPGPGIVQGLNYSQFNVLGEFAVHDRFSFFAELPFRSIRPTAFVPGTGSFDNQSGIGDITAGVKASLFASDTTDATVMVRGAFPNGDSEKGLGTAHGTIEPAFLFRQDMGERAGLEGQFGYVHPLSSSKGPLPGNGDFAGGIVYYGIGPSFDVVRNDHAAFSPVVELVGWHVVSGYQTSTFVTGGTGDASGINIANLKIGGRVTVNRSSFYVGYGFALTDNDWYGKILRFEYRAGF